MLDLQHLHSKNIVHYDIKINLAHANGEWFLCDYGTCVDLSITPMERSHFTVSYVPMDIPMRSSKRLDTIFVAVIALVVLDPNSRRLMSRFHANHDLDSILI